MKRPVYLARPCVFMDNDPKYRRMDVFAPAGPPRWLAWVLVAIGVLLVVGGALVAAGWRL